MAELVKVTIIGLFRQQAYLDPLAGNRLSHYASTAFDG